MKKLNIIRLSGWVSNLSIMIIISMQIINVFCWFFPNITISSGINIGLSTKMLLLFPLEVKNFSVWQTISCIIFSSIPLLSMSYGLWNMHLLFKGFNKKDYFSENASNYLKKSAKGIAFWSILNFVCEPFLSLFATWNAPPGKHTITLSFGSPDFLALYLSGCLIVISFVFSKAHTMNNENSQFV